MSVSTAPFIDGDRWASLSLEEQEQHRVAWAEAMSDPAFADSLARGLADIAAGRVHKWEDVKKELAMTDERDPEPLEITTDTDADDATPADVDAVPDVREDRVPEDDASVAHEAPEA